MLNLDLEDLLSVCSVSLCMHLYIDWFPVDLSFLTNVAPDPLQYYRRIIIVLLMLDSINNELQ